MEALINGTTYYVKEGAVFTECYNETLDSGTIVIPHLTSKMTIAPYDVVTITGDNIETKRMLVDTYTCTQISLDPTIYEYQISLFSETKLLEGILLPSLSITVLSDINHRRSVWDYLQQYVNEYGTKIKQNNSYVAKFSFDNSVQTKFSNIVCPELQWNEPTLREVLTDLMMTVDCIPVVNNNIIGYIDISHSGSEITVDQRSGINYIRESQSSTDYLSELKMNLKNTIGSTNVVFDKIGFRNYESYLLTTENVQLETSSPIWNLKRVSVSGSFKCNVTFLTGYIEGGQVTVNGVQEGAVADLFNENNAINYILEYGEWLTKDIYYGGFSVNNQDLSSDYQNTCLYYIREQKGIHNFDAKQEKQFLWISSQASVLELVIEYLRSAFEEQVEEELIEQYQSLYPDAHDFTFNYNAYPIAERQPNYKNLLFSVVYDTLSQQTFLASKENKFGIRQVVDNQTQSYINVGRQGMLEYFKANRLGNKLKLINGRYNDVESNIPQLADKVNDSIIFQKEISVYENHINVNYSATENYVLRDYFTGIKAKLRSWPILSGESAFIRADILKYFVNENIERHVDANSLIPSLTMQQYLDQFNYCLIQFKDAPASYFPRGQIEFDGTNYNVDAIQVEFQKAICGNSVLFTIRMYDNAIAGKYIASDNYEVSSSSYVMTQKNCSYVDENGENLGGKILFYQTKSSSLDEIIESKLLPYSNTNNFTDLVAEIPFTFHKDNKEITQITIQFELNEDANDIFLGKV